VSFLLEEASRNLPPNMANVKAITCKPGKCAHCPLPATIIINMTRWMQSRLPIPLVDRAERLKMFEFERVARSSEISPGFTCCTKFRGERESAEVFELILLHIEASKMTA
jgi:hypothetical protein